MRGVSLLVVSLLGATAHSPDRDSLRGQLEPASTGSSAPRSSRPTLIGSKVKCKGAAPSLRTIDVRTWEEGNYQTPGTNDAGDGWNYNWQRADCQPDWLHYEEGSPNFSPDNWDCQEENCGAPPQPRPRPCLRGRA